MSIGDLETCTELVCVRLGYRKLLESFYCQLFTGIYLF